MIKKVNVEIRIKEVNSNQLSHYAVLVMVVEIFNNHTTTKKQE